MKLIKPRFLLLGFLWNLITKGLDATEAAIVFCKIVMDDQGIRNVKNIIISELLRTLSIAVEARESGLSIIETPPTLSGVFQHIFSSVLVLKLESFVSLWKEHIWLFSSYSSQLGLALNS